MKALYQIGRYFFAIAIIAFGVQYFLYGRFVGGLPPVPPWTPGGRAGAHLVGAFLVAAGVGLAINQKARWSALLLGTVFLLCVLLLHGPRMHDILVDGVARTRALEPLALSGVAFALAGSLSDRQATADAIVKTNKSLVRWGHFLFALPMIVFGIQHFQYARFIAVLIPSWIPGPWFWTYFTGLGFIAAALSIMTKIAGRLPASLLGLMFFLWLVLLHTPRVLASLHNGDEWSSAFVALAMSGGSFIIAGQLATDAETR